MWHKDGINLVLKLRVLFSHWENRNTLKAIGFSLGMSRSPRAEVQDHTFLQNTKGWISDKGYPQKGEPISKNLYICYWEHAVFKEIQLRNERDSGVKAFHFFLNSLWEKHKRDEGVLLPWQLGEAQAGRGYSGTDKAWHPDSRWEKWGPGDWVGMNNLLFSYSSATLPDLKTEPIELNSMHSDCDWWISIHAFPLTWKAHPLLV